MAEVSLIGSCPTEDLPQVLRALYGVLRPDDVGTMKNEGLSHLAFVPAYAVGVVTNGGDEGININSEASPMVARIQTNNIGPIHGYLPTQFANQVNFALGNGHVYITPSDRLLIFRVTYADPEAHAVEQRRVSEAVSRCLQNVQVR